MSKVQSQSISERDTFELCGEGVGKFSDTFEKQTLDVGRWTLDIALIVYATIEGS
jgi:hypothetical protein